MNSKTLKFSIVTVSILMLLLACATAEKPAPEPVKPAPPKAMPSAQTQESSSGVSYAANLQPIMLESCSPCHYPEKGKKELLDSYDATARFIDDIIYRIQLPADSTEFMPYKSKKMPLTLDQIQLFIDWRDAGMPD